MKNVYSVFLRFLFLFFAALKKENMSFAFFSVTPCEKKVTLYYAASIQ